MFASPPLQLKRKSLQNLLRLAKLAFAAFSPLLLFNFPPSVNGNPDSSLPSLPGPLLFSKWLWWLAAHKKVMFPLPEWPGKCLPRVYISQPHLHLGRAMNWFSYQWSVSRELCLFLAKVFKKLHVCAFLLCHWKQRIRTLRMLKPQCGRSLGLWSSTWSKTVHSPRCLSCMWHD